MGSLKKFPPLEPWQFLWSFMSFGKHMIEKFGRERLLAAPAHEILEHDNLIHIQAFDFVFRSGENLIPRSTEQRKYRVQRAEAMLQHLGLQLPYETIF